MINDNLYSKKTYNIIGPQLFTRASFKGSVVFVKLRGTGKIFCELGVSLYGQQKYYDLDDFFGTNVIRRCATSEFGNSSETLWDARKPFLSLTEGCRDARGWMARYLFDDMIMRELCTFMTAEITPRSLAEVETLGSVKEDRTVAHIYQTRTGNFIYIIDNVVYSEYFPVKWALAPGTLEYENGVAIMGPGTLPNHCGNCNYYGSFHGVFLGYCVNCAREYGYTRGPGFIDQGVEYEGEAERDCIRATYLSGIDLATLGYNIEPEEKYNNCLAGGNTPTGPDICDDQENMDPVRENVVDEYKEADPNTYNTIVLSKKYPRRAYSMPFMKYRIVVEEEQTDTFTPDLIRHKMESFFAENDIEVIDNNYSFPIGPRPEWDCYRITKRPSVWFYWIATFRCTGYEDIQLEIRLYVSNVHTAEHPAKLLLECNNVSGRSPGYWPMMRAMNAWLLGETDNPLIDIPLPPPGIEDEDGNILPPPIQLY
uniref:Uncharacterized protein n=1 Tax=viral metagenome TaxID=1070528 RepID=A0A6C0JXQ8_9ZZZZ